MKKQILILISALLLTGCGNTSWIGMPKTSDTESGATILFPDADPTQNSKEEFDMVASTTYLTDKDDITYVCDSLMKAGVSKERVNNLSEHINQFNASVDTDSIKGSFSEKKLLNIPYDPYELQDQWVENSPGFDGYNCRITSFSLFSEFLTIPESAGINDNELFMDKDSLSADPSALINSDLNSFLRFYSTIPATDSKDSKTQAETLIKSLENRGIKFNAPENIADITVWFHNQWSENENELFCGHTGILVNTGSDLLFIEKIAFMEPYKATKFKTLNDLKSYLLAKYDVDYGQNTAPPFIMLNDKLL